MNVDEASSYRLIDGITTYRWLCARHVAECKSQGWTLEQLASDMPFCDQCEIERQGGAA